MRLHHPRLPVSTARRKPRARARPDERGASFVEYAAVLLVGAAIVTAVLASGAVNPGIIAGGIRDSLDTAFCEIQGRSECAGTSESSSDDEGQQNAPAPNEHPDTHGAEPPEPEPYQPSDEDFEDARDDISEIRDHLEGNDWYNPFSWGAGSDPAEVMSEMTPTEINTLLWSLEEDELEEILNDSERREIALSQANLETLRMIREEHPTLIETDYTDVGGDDAGDDGGPEGPLSFEEQEDGRLWGEDGEVSSDDLSQGQLGDCWWLAGMGAVADQNPGVIHDMIETNDNGTYTVTFPDTGEEITVTPDLVENEQGTTFSDPQDGVMWPAILEKAYAEREGSYGATEGGWASEGMEMVTGEESDTYNTDEISASDLDGWLSGDTTAVTVSTPPEDESDGDFYDKDPVDGGLANSHAYVVDEVRDGKVYLTNPWGDSHPDPIPIGTFQEDLNEVAINTNGA